MTQLQTINECPRVLSSVYPAHSIGKPGVPSKTTYINVRFATLSSFQLQMKRSMKTTTIPNRPEPFPPFRHAALPDNFILPSILEAAPMTSPTPFADLMLHPEKLEAALRIARRQNDDFEASRQQK